MFSGGPHSFLIIVHTIEPEKAATKSGRQDSDGALKVDPQARRPDSVKL